MLVVWLSTAFGIGGLIGWAGGYCLGWLVATTDTERRWLTLSSGAAMTSLEALIATLIAEWRARVDDVRDLQFNDQPDEVLLRCADELDAALRSVGPLTTSPTVSLPSRETPAKKTDRDLDPDYPGTVGDAIASDRNPRENPQRVGTPDGSALNLEPIKRALRLGVYAHSEGLVVVAETTIDQLVQEVDRLRALLQQAQSEGAELRLVLYPARPTPEGIVSNQDRRHS